MGHRSDIRIMTTKKGFNKLKEYTDNYLKDKNFTYGNLLDDLDLNYETKYAKYFGWNSMKWYEECEGYEDVDAIMNGLRYLKEIDYSYRYARIGEDYSDYDEFYYESSNEEEQDLEYPCMTRYFDDEYIIKNMKLNDKGNDLEV